MRVCACVCVRVCARACTQALGRVFAFDGGSSSSTTTTSTSAALRSRRSAVEAWGPTPLHPASSQPTTNTRASTNTTRTISDPNGAGDALGGEADTADPLDGEAGSLSYAGRMRVARCVCAAPWPHPPRAPRPQRLRRERGGPGSRVPGPSTRRVRVLRYLIARERARQAQREQTKAALKVGMQSICERRGAALALPLLGSVFFNGWFVKDQIGRIEIKPR